jgi:hypothetical protein
MLQNDQMKRVTLIGSMQNEMLVAMEFIRRCFALQTVDRPGRTPNLRRAVPAVRDWAPYSVPAGRLTSRLSLARRAFQSGSTRESSV